MLKKTSQPGASTPKEAISIRFRTGGYQKIKEKNKISTEYYQINFFKKFFQKKILRLRDGGWMIFAPKHVKVLYLRKRSVSQILFGLSRPA
jgi:hypothetical protein